MHVGEMPRRLLTDRRRAVRGELKIPQVSVEEEAVEDALLVGNLAVPKDLGAVTTVGLQARRGAKLGSSLLFRWRRMRYRGKGAFAVLVTMKGLGESQSLPRFLPVKPVCVCRGRWCS